MSKIKLLKELQKRYQNELDNPTREGWNHKTKTYHPIQNKSKLKRLRLLIQEVMVEIEDEII